MGRDMEELAQTLGNCLLVCLCFLFSCGSACAGDAKSIVPKHTFAVGVGVCSFDYEEEDEEYNIDVERDGLMYEVAGEYTYHNSIMINGSLDYSIGDLDYDGYLMTVSSEGELEFEPFQKKNLDSEKVECRGLIGYDFMYRGKHMLTPFVGAGYRYWNREVGDFEMHAKYWYAPVGIETHSPLSDNWTWGMSLEYDLFLDGAVDTDIPRIPTLYLDSGYGVTFSLRLTRQLTKNAGLSFEPYITYWDIHKSDRELYIRQAESGAGEHYVFTRFEPKNSTTSYGLRTSLEF